MKEKTNTQTTTQKNRLLCRLTNSQPRESFSNLYDDFGENVAKKWMFENEEMIVAVNAIYAIPLRSLKKIQDFNGVWTRDLAITGAMLYQLSYEATDVWSRSIVGSYVPVKEVSVNDIWNKSKLLSWEHMNPQLTCSQRQWLHISVGRASHP